jgi:hypothetical protein
MRRSQVERIFTIRLRPSTLQNQMQQILDKLSAGECTMGEVQGFASGAYGGGVADGSADSGGSVALTYTTAPKLVSGTYDGAVAGGNFGAYKSGKVGFDIDDRGAFFAGRLVRVTGATGIFMGGGDGRDASQRAGCPHQHVHTR